VMSSTEVGRANQAGINRGMRNAQEAVSLLQTAESGLAAIEEIYIHLREIAVTASGNHLTVSELAIMEAWFQDTRLDPIRIIDVTAYGDHLLLNGTVSTGGTGADGEFTFQVGFQSEVSAQTTVQLEDPFDPHVPWRHWG
jgi:flagellin